MLEFVIRYLITKFDTPVEIIYKYFGVEAKRTIFLFLVLNFVIK